MILVDNVGQTETTEALQFCPFCQKLFTQEKLLFKHIVGAHKDCEYMSYSFHANLYSRWQERNPRLEH